MLYNDLTDIELSDRHVAYVERMDCTDFEDAVDELEMDGEDPGEWAEAVAHVFGVDADAVWTVWLDCQTASADCAAERRNERRAFSAR